jgi:geranylgeranyl pyrophosphate synthase
MVDLASSRPDGAAKRAIERYLAAVGAELPMGEQGLAPYLAGGKRLRAQLVLLVCALGRHGASECAVRYAAFVELIHAGGLCHDDVVDHSTIRRGRTSVAQAFGTPAAAFSGIFLMARGYAIVAHDDERVRRAVAETARRVAHGQAAEMSDLFLETVSPEEYLGRARDKTAALFELAAWLGARAGELDEAATAAVVSYAGHVGLAFQLADDVRDFIGGPELGREAGTDLREGVYTLPVLLTLAGRCPGGEELRSGLRALRAGSSPAAFASFRDFFRRNGAFALTQRTAAALIDEALACLVALPRCAAREELERYAAQVVAGLPVEAPP